MTRDELKSRLKMPHSVKICENTSFLWHQTCSKGGGKWRRTTLAALSAHLSPDPRICTLTPNGHLELGALSGSRRSYSSERRSFTIESRKSSVMSLGKSSLERRSYSLVRRHTLIHWHIHAHISQWAPNWSMCITANHFCPQFLSHCQIFNEHFFVVSKSVFQFMSVWCETLFVQTLNWHWMVVLHSTHLILLYIILCLSGKSTICIKFNRYCMFTEGKRTRRFDFFGISFGNFAV